MEEVSFLAGRDTLNGLLALPESGVSPVLIYVPGRGYTDLYESGGIDLAGRLARKGVGVLLFDARGTGGSSGDRKSVTDQERHEEVVAALDHLLGREDIDTDKIGLLSSSAGGWVAPGVVAERSEVAFLITQAGPAEGLDEQQAHVTQEFMERSGTDYSPEEYKMAMDFERQLVRLSARNAGWEAYRPLVEAAKASNWWEHADQPESIDDPVLDYYRKRTGFNDVSALDAVTIPFLAIYGGNDPIVPPKYNAPLLEAAMERAGNTDYEIVVLEGADHSLGFEEGFVGSGEWTNRYFQPYCRSPLYYPTLINWLQKTVLDE